jgi:hypothetical protein
MTKPTSDELAVQAFNEWHDYQMQDRAGSPCPYIAWERKAFLAGAAAATERAARVAESLVGRGDPGDPTNTRVIWHREASKLIARAIREGK